MTTTIENASLLKEKGLDIPFAAKLTRALDARGVYVDNDFTVQDFAEKLLAYAKTKGAGMRSVNEGGRRDE